MFTYQVNDMTCGHCAGAITKAILAVDSEAKVDVDVSRHLVHVESTNAAEATLSQAIQSAGYQPVAVQPSTGRPAAPRTGGCCCGSGAARCGT